MATKGPMVPPEAPGTAVPPSRSSMHDQCVMVNPSPRRRRPGTALGHVLTAACDGSSALVAIMRLLAARPLRHYGLQRIR